MTTNNAVNVPLSGNTGTGNFVGATSPTLVTPTIGAATATTITFSPTTGGIVGTTTNDNTNAGNVGEVISSSVAASGATSISNTTATNVTSITLSAGDWDVVGNIMFIQSGNLNHWQGGISTTSATLPDFSLRFFVSSGGLFNDHSGAAVPSQRISVSGSTVVYLVGEVNIASGTCTQCGTIYARRAR